MKKMTALLGLAVACLCSTAFAADFSNLVIVHTNDSHGYDRRAEGINGMATVSALKKAQPCWRAARINRPTCLRT